MTGTNRASKFLVQVRIIQGYLVVSSPDFDIHQTERMDSVTPETIGKLVLNIWKRVDQMTLENKQASNPKTPGTDAAISDTWLSTKDASKILQLSEQSIRRMATNKELHTYRTPGGHRRFSEQEVRSIAEKIRKPTL